MNPHSTSKRSILVALSIIAAQIQTGVHIFTKAAALPDTPDVPVSSHYHPSGPCTRRSHKTGVRRIQRAAKKRRNQLRQRRAS